MRRLLLALLVLGLVAVGAALLALFLVEDVPFSEDAVLVWHMDGPIYDYSAVPYWPWDERRGETSLIDLYLALARARDDDSIAGLAVYIHDARFGIAKAQQIRRMLESFAESGKFVDCYLETAGEGTNGTLAYYVTTGCQTIRLAPGGDLNLLGLLADRTFLRGTFDKLKIEPHFAWVGRYKSAVEGYTQRESSEAAAEALDAVLDDYYDDILGAVARARGLTVERVSDLVDGAPYGAREALAAGLVDALAYPDEFGDHIDERVGGEASLIAIDRYEHRAGRPFARNVAMVFAQGSIRRGFGGIEPWTGQVYIGSRDLASTLHDLAEDDSVDAVVLRIDSPGGSALASDLILREVERLAREKPLVVSMSDLAASGGYYIASKARHIVAEPSTLTGSIGVFGGKLVTRRFEEDLLGITHDAFKRGENSDIYSSLEPFSEGQLERIQALMQRVYDTFVEHVAAGRDLSTDDVERVAQGRVWTGRAALDHGLVDTLGGFEEALRLVREELDLAPTAKLRLDLYPKAPGLIDYLLGRAQPFLRPMALPEPLEALREEHLRLLELPRSIADFSRPF